MLLLVTFIMFSCPTTKTSYCYFLISIWLPSQWLSFFNLLTTASSTPYSIWSFPSSQKPTFSLWTQIAMRDNEISSLIFKLGFLLKSHYAEKMWKKQECLNKSSQRMLISGTLKKKKRNHRTGELKGTLEIISHHD